MNALAGLMNPAAVGQSFQQGLEFGRAKRAEAETGNAFNALLQNPMDQEALGTLGKYNPQAAFAMQDRSRQIQAERDKAEKERQAQNLFRAAMAGDENAMNELAVQSFDKWKSLDKVQKDQATNEAKIFGQAALDILNRPPEQRGAAIQAYAQQLGQEFPDVMQIVQLPPEQQEAALRAAVAEAQLIEKLISQERPDYQAVAKDADLVNVRDPMAVRAFGEVRGQNAPPAPPEAVAALQRGEGTPEQFDQMFGQGAAARVMGGGAGNGASGF